MTHLHMTIVGNVGKNPELRYTSSGVAVTNFSLAVNDSYTKQDGTRVDETTWFRVTCWRRQAEVVAQYAQKGKQVLVVASKIEANAYTNRAGESAASLDVTADRVVFLQGGDSGQSGNGGQRDDFDSVDVPF